MQQQFNDLIEDLKTTHGENLVSVILYGSAAAGGFVPFHSDYNLLIALNEITPEELKNAHACMREWTRLGHPVPVYFTVGELEKAGDVFPIEFHIMERARKVLFGPDVLADIEISDRNLRHQLEYELRSNLLKLRRKYIGVSTDAGRLSTLMEASLTSFAADFRAIFLLRGIEPPTDTAGIVRATVAELGLAEAAFEKILVIRENESERPMNVTAANELFADYLRSLEDVIDRVDSMD